MSSLSRITRNSFFLTSGFLISRIIVFFTYILVTRYLDVAFSGKFFAGMSFIGIFIVIMDWNLHMLLIREISRNKSITGAYLWSVFKIKAPLTGLLFLVVYIVGSFLYSGDSFKVILILTPAIILANYSMVISSVFRAFEKMEIDALQMALGTISFLAFILAARYLNLGLLGISFAFLFAEIFTFLLNLFLYFHLFHKYSDVGLKVKSISIFKESIPLGFAFLFASVYFQIGIVMLSKISGDTQAGLFGVAHRLFMTITMFPALISAAFYPAFSKFYVENKEKLKEFFIRGTEILFLITFPIVAGVMVLSSRIITFFGENFGPGEVALKILIWALILNALTVLISQIIVSSGRQKVLAYVAGVAMVFAVVLNLIFIPKFGLLAASFNTVLTELLVLILYYLEIKKTNKIFVPLLRLAWGPAVASLVMATAVYYLNFLNIIVLIALGALIYFLTLILTKTITKKEFLLLKDAFLLKTNAKEIE